MKHYVLFLAFAASLFGCVDTRSLTGGVAPKNVADSSLMVDVDMAFESEPLMMEEAFEKLSLVPLETSPQSVMARVTKIAVTGSRIFVLDDYNGGRVSIFDINGQFVTTLPQGQSSSEYAKATSIHWDANGQRLLVFDEASQKLLSYTPDGKFLQSTYLEGWNTDAVATPSGVLATQSPRTNSSRQMMVTWTSSTKSAFSWNLGECAVKMAEPQADLQDCGGGYLVSKPFDNCIYYFKNGQLFRRYVLSSAENRDWDQLDDPVQLMRLLNENECFFEGRNYESQNYLLVMYMQKRGGGVIVYSKKSSQAYRLSALDKTSILGWIQPKSVYSYSGDVFAGVIDLSFASDGNCTISSMNGLVSPADMEMLKGLSSGDKPVIVLFKLKSGI